MIKIFTGRLLLPVESKPLAEGALAVEDGKILEVGHSQKITKKFSGAENVDIGNVAILPGLVNPHVHLELTLHGPRKGVSRIPFPFWLLGMVVGTRIRRKNHFVNSLQNGIEQVKSSGTTAVGHIATFLRDPSEFFMLAGIRAVVFLEAIGLDPAQSDKIAKKIKGEIDDFDAKSDMVKPGISPHAPYSVSRELFRKLAGISKKQKIFTTVHLAESADEIKLFESNRGAFKKVFYPLLGLRKFAPKPGKMTPVEYLKDAGILDSHISAVHCVQINDSDIAILRNAKTPVVLCPRSNYYLNVGTAPLKKLLDEGINVSLGTDGLVSNVSLSLWDEARFVKRMNPWISSEQLLRMMTVNAARSVGLSKIGALAPDMCADFIAVNLTGFDGTQDIYDFLIANTEKKKIQGVWVGGIRVDNYPARIF